MICRYESAVIDTAGSHAVGCGRRGRGEGLVDSQRASSGKWRGGRYGFRIFEEL